MTLFEAIQIVARVHTRDDDEIGFVVEMGATPRYDHNRYVKAWGTIRREAGLPCDPVDTAPPPASESERPTKRIETRRYPYFRTE